VQKVKAPQPRREPRGTKSIERVEGLLRVAHDVFAEKGFEHATTAEIARRLGVSEATVFSYFASKRELCVEVVRRWYDKITGELETELPAIEGFRDKLSFTIRKHLATLLGDEAGLCSIILSEGRLADEAFVQVIAELKRRYTAPLMHALEEARTRGELRRDVPVRLFRDMVYGSMEHVLWDRITTGRMPDLARTATDLAALLYDAFMQREASHAALARFHAEVVSAARRVAETTAAPRTAARGAGR
jgi:AcrR family transcriptional regulator